MLSKGPLELADLIASYLECNDLASCVLVSKSWRDIFLPHQWRVITAGANHLDCLQCFGVLPVNSDPWQGPHPDEIHRRRHLIHTLVLVGDLSGLDKLDYPNLTRLQIDLCLRAEGQEGTISLELTKQCPLLAHLVLLHVTLTSETWMDLSNHLHIKTLHLQGSLIEAVDTPGFWSICKKLESLTLDYVTIRGGGIPKDMVFSRLRHLKTVMIRSLEDTEKMDLVLQSPVLESLGWEEHQYERNMEQSLIRHPIQTHYWSYLKKVDISWDIHETDLAFILGGTGRGLGNIVDLQLRNCKLKPQALRAFHLHLSTLVKLDLSQCYYVSGSTILDILCSSPKLEVLKAKRVTVMDIAERGPWICQQLRELKICILVLGAEKDLQQLVFERLSTLVRLETLIMWVPDEAIWDEDRLEFQLDCGMGRLASLQQLTTLSFNQGETGEYMPQLGKDEVLWMIDNWKELQIIYGRLNRIPETETSLRSIFESHGISASFSSYGDVLTPL